MRPFWKSFFIIALSAVAIGAGVLAGTVWRERPEHRRGDALHQGGHPQADCAHRGLSRGDYRVVVCGAIRY